MPTSVVQRVAALFVDPQGPYAGRKDVDAWGEDRDARLYTGPHPVVAHPPCQRWGKFYWRGPGGTRGKLGDDGGCFAAALLAVETYGGVLEHPDGSLAWAHFGLVRPTKVNQWIRGGRTTGAGWSCLVDQSRYGHRAQKRTLLYYVGLGWPIGVDTRPQPGTLVSTGSARVGVELMTKLERRLTPAEFAQALIDLARLSQEDPAADLS